jgi:hypothetical protein
MVLIGENHQDIVGGLSRHVELAEEDPPEATPN